MCLTKPINDKPDSDIGYKVMIRYSDHSFIHLHLGCLIRTFNEEYIRSGPERISYQDSEESYPCGFHVYRFLDDAKAELKAWQHTERMVIVKVRGRNLLASGLQKLNYNDRMVKCDVYEFMTILEVVDADILTI